MTTQLQTRLPPSVGKVHPQEFSVARFLTRYAPWLLVGGGFLISVILSFLPKPESDAVDNSLDAITAIAIVAIAMLVSGVVWGIATGMRSDPD